MDADHKDRGLRVAELSLFALLFGWLAWAAVTVDVEYYDGWDAVSNARIFAGTTLEAGYVPNRAPMMAWLLMPGEVLRLQTGGDALDPRPYHLVSAVLHAVYLLGVYWLLCRVWGRGWAVLVSFVVAVPSFLFFAYGPFLSHDIFPGLLLLAMTVCLGRWLESPSWRVWLALVALGAFAALIKQTYGLFWMVLPLAALSFWLVPAWRAGSGHAALRWRHIAWLAAGATLAGVITWLGLAWALSYVLGVEEFAFLRRPLVQMAEVDRQPRQFPWWVYLRNAPAVGLLTVLLLLPGMWLARRSGHQAVRISLVSLPIFLICLQLISFREVRYLIFLAPLAALLIVPAVQRLLERQWTTIALMAVLVFECFPPFPWPRVPEALRLAQPFYRQSELREFVGAVREHRKGVLVYQGHFLGFRPEALSRLVGDRNNEIFHFGPHHLYNLERIGAENFVGLDARKAAPMAVPPGTVVVGSTGSLLNRALWTHSARSEPIGLGQYVKIGVGLRVERSVAGSWHVPGRGPVMLSHENGRPVLESAVLAEALRDAEQPSLVVGKTVVGSLKYLGEGRYAVEGQIVRNIGGVESFLVLGQRVVYRQSYDTALPSAAPP